MSDKVAKTIHYTGGLMTSTNNDITKRSCFAVQKFKHLAFSLLEIFDADLYHTQQLRKPVGYILLDDVACNK